MKKVIAIGCPGSGKTTFCEKLKKYTGLPLYYLDAIWHKSDRTHISRDEYDEKLCEIFKEDKWIIDGNYQRTIEERIKESDTIFLFDLPLDVCIKGATERLGKKRCDIPWIDYELDPDFEKEIDKFPQKNLPDIYKYIEKYGKNKKIIIFKSHSDVDLYFENKQYLT